MPNMDFYQPVGGPSYPQITIINIVAIADSMIYIENVNVTLNTVVTAEL